MDCQTIQNQLSGLLDGALDSPTALLVETHLDDCELCRAQKEALASLDASLTRALAAERSSAERVAVGVLERLSGQSTTESPNRSTSTWRQALGYLIAVAAGFVLAVICFRPWQRPDALTTATDSDIPPAVETLPAADALPQFGAAVAQFVHTTGPISYRPTSGSEWEQVDVAQLQTFGCPSDSCVRTAPGALAELKTAGGSRIRLNESSEVSFVSDQELQLKQGQIWCRADGDDTLRVVTGHSDDASATVPQIPALVCSTSSEFVASCSPTQPLQVVSAAGTVEVSTGDRAQTLAAGRSCTISNGNVEVRESEGDLLNAERWMQPLLTLGGHGNPELTRRVDALLACLGRTKLAYLYEQDLRNLGEYGALPLLRFVQSQASQGEAVRRQKAMDILADTAPIWMVPDLISLLEDDDPSIRVAAARGLTRLTGTDLGMTPDDWGGDPADLTDGLSRWQAWWQQQRFACPTAPPSASPQSNEIY